MALTFVFVGVQCVCHGCVVDCYLGGYVPPTPLPWVAWYSCEESRWPPRGLGQIGDRPR